jgi:hypothetical protein
MLNSFLYLALHFAKSGCNIILPPLQSSDNSDKLFSLVIDAPGQESLVKIDQKHEFIFIWLRILPSQAAI